ncbi:MAG: ABC transporter permease [Planctomycetota bacterium]
MSSSETLSTKGSKTLVSLLGAIYRQPSFKLALGLVAIFFFFVVAVGVHEGISIHSSNRQIIAKVEAEGVSRAEAEKDPRLLSAWKEGYFASIGFLSRPNLEMMARHTTIVGIAALGMTMVIIAGGIDLSVGSIIALSSVVVAWLLQHGGVGPWTAVFGGIAAAAACGLISGLLITQLRVVPFIVTLGMLLIVRGAAKGIGHEQKIDVAMERVKWLDDLLASVPKGSWMLLPWGAWLLIVMAVIVAAMLRYTRIGRHIFAVGSNEETARLCGVGVDRVKVAVFAMCGAFAGLAGVMQFSFLSGVGDPTGAMGLELNVIAAVVIGGGSLAGGEGSILGTVVGALIMTVIDTGCGQMGLPNWVQEIIMGVIIVVAVALDRLRHRRSA